MQSIIGIITLSVIWALILYVILALRTRKLSRSMIFSLMGVIILFLLLYVGVEIYEFTENPEFCGTTCHPMDLYYVTYKDNPHNSTMMGIHTDEDVNCADCHNERGIVGAVKSRIEGMRSLMYYLMGWYDIEHMPAEVPKDACIKGHCHDSVDWVLVGVDDDAPLHPDVETLETCSECHNPHSEGIDLNEEACIYCHDLTMADIEIHGEYVNVNFQAIVGDVENTGKCTDCHHRKEKVPYMPSVPREFCADCHPEHNEEIITYGGRHLGYLEECSSCHETHQLLHDCWSPTCHPNEIGPRTENLFGNLSIGEFLVSYAEDPDCANCHIPFLSSGARDHTLSFEYWPARGSHRLGHTSNEWCDQCHDPHKAPANRYPTFVSLDDEGCTNECHIWLSLDNKPRTLLENTATSHNALYVENGCTGLCHHDPDATSENIHSFVMSCLGEDCHQDEFSTFLNSQGHIAHHDVILGAHSCYSVCHDDSGNYLAPGCYGCHYSGHDPRLTVGSGGG